jgi:pentatricopeptide repeat protein
MGAIVNGSKRGRQVAQRVESLLDEMITLSKRHKELAPAVMCFNVALNAWSKSGSDEAIDRCEALLEKMQGLKLSPDVFSYTALIDAIARSGQKAERVDAILNRMAEEGVDPNVVTYSAVINGTFGCPSMMLRGEPVLTYLPDFSYFFQRGLSQQHQMQWVTLFLF